VAKAIRLRRRSRREASLTAASTPVTSAKSLKSPLSKSARDGNWQDRAWDYLDLVGELSYYVGWRSASVSRCRLVASDVDQDGIPTGSTENERVNEIVRAIGGKAQAQLLQRAAALLTVPGEHWIGVLQRSPDRETSTADIPISGEVVDATEWVVLSRDELKKKSEDIELSLPDGTKHLFDPEADVLFRVWNPHPRSAQEATSPVRAAQTALNEIVRATATIDKAGQSRLIGNGVLFVPQEMSLPSQQAPVATPVDGLPDAPAPNWEPASSQDLTDLLYQVAEAAVEDPSSMAAFMPVVASVPGEWTDKVKHVRFDSEVSEKAIATRDKALTRLAMSLDVAPERLLGMGANSNHWSAWLIDEDDVKIHLAPVLETICAAITREVLVSTLVAEGIDPDKYVIWYDATALTQDPDRKAEAKDAHNVGAMRSDAYMEHLGFDPQTDGYDLSTLAGWQVFARDQVAKDPNLITTYAPLLGDVIPKITPPALPTAEPDAAEPDDDVVEAEPEDGPPAEIEASGVASAIIETLTLRALELAGKRRRTRSNGDAFRARPLHAVHEALPPVQPGEVLSLIAGWDDAVAWDRVTAALGFERSTVTRWVEMDAADTLTKER
jgi:hypothetical protein